MRFMMMVKCDADFEAGKPPSAELMKAMGQYSAEMTRAGVLLEQGALHPSAKGARVSVEGGNTTVLDGPFSETKELIGGYAIIQAASKAEAIEHGKRFLRVHTDVFGPSYVGTVEIRQLMGPEDMKAFLSSM